MLINIIDMSQTAGLIDTDLSSDAFDFAVFAGHKTLYGPLGIAGFTCSGKVKPAPLLMRDRSRFCKSACLKQYLKG